MRYLIVLLFVFAACAAPTQDTTPPDASQPTPAAPKDPTKGPGHYDITVDAGVPNTEVDAGSDVVPDVPADSPIDPRVSVAYCAAAALVALPKHCAVMPNDDSALLIHTVCDNAEIKWNCDTCGDVLRNGVVIGHVVMKSDTVFQVSGAAAGSAAYLCTMDSVGSGFTTELYH